MSIVMKEQLIRGQHTPISIKGVKKIEDQMENCICKIYKNEIIGTGSICKISDKLYALITNNNVLNEKDIEMNKMIDISINNKRRTIMMDKNRKKYTDKELDTVFICSIYKSKVQKFLAWVNNSWTNYNFYMIYLIKHWYLFKILF